MPVSPDLVVLGGTIASGDDRQNGVECPCGCGTRLFPYGGATPLVCFSAWRSMAIEDQRLIMGFGVSDAVRREAARRILNVAAAIRSSRQKIAAACE